MENKRRYKLIKTKHAWVRVAAATTFMIGGIALGGTSVFADTTATPVVQPADNDQAQTVAQTQKIAAANDDYNNTKQAIDKTAADVTAKAQQTTSDLENKEKAAATADLQNQINTDQDKKAASDKQVTDIQGQISDTQQQINTLENQAANNHPEQVYNGNEATKSSTVDTSKSLLQNVAQDNLWGSKDLSQSNGNIIPQNVYVSPDNQRDDAIQTNPKTWGIFTGANITDNPQYQNYANLDPIVDPDKGITDAQAQEMSEMLLNALNSARVAKGYAPFVMSQEKFNQAQVRASQPSAAILEHNKKDSLAAFAGKYQNENLAVNGHTIAPKSMADLYNWAIYSLVDMIDNDGMAQWGHRDNFFENTYQTKNVDAAFGFKFYPKILDNGVKLYTLVTTFDYNLVDRAGTDNTLDQINDYAKLGPITSDKTDKSQVDDLKTKLAGLQAQLTQNQATATQLQTQIDNLNEQKANVSFNETKLSQADQTVYNVAQKAANQAATAKEAQIKAAQKIRDEKIQTAQAKLASLNTEIDNLKAQPQAIQEASEPTPTESEKSSETTPVKTNDNGSSHLPSASLTSNDNHGLADGVNRQNNDENTAPVKPINDFKIDDHESETPTDNAVKSAPVPLNAKVATVASNSNKAVVNGPATEIFPVLLATAPASDKPSELVTQTQKSTKTSTAANHSNALPQTGQSNNRGLNISGIMAIIASFLLGLGSFLKFRTRN